MFLHERTRIAFCRLGYVACCALPTLAVVVWIAWLHTGWHVHSVGNRASSLAGIEVTIGQVQHPRRDRTIWHEVVLVDPSSGELLATAEQIELLEVDRGVRLRVAGGQLNALMAQPAREAVLRRLTRAPADASGVWLSAAALTWNYDGQPVELLDVKCGIEPGPEASQAFLTFRLDESSTRGPRVRLVDHLDHQRARYELELHTDETSLPCRWLDPFGIDLSRLGPDAVFQGSLRSHWIDRQWVTQAIGRLSHIDLAQLLGPESPHRITGQAQLETEPAAPLRVRGHRLERLTANITAGPGEISPSLLQATDQHLEMRHVRVPAQASGNYPYQQLALKVHLEQQGLIVQGRCDANGTVVTDHSGPLVSQPARPKSVAHLVSALSPPSSALMPATHQAQTLASYLPVAPVAADASQRMGIRPPAASPPATQAR